MHLHKLAHRSPLNLRVQDMYLLQNARCMHVYVEYRALPHWPRMFDPYCYIVHRGEVGRQTPAPLFRAEIREIKIFRRYSSIATRVESLGIGMFIMDPPPPPPPPAEKVRRGNTPGPHSFGPRFDSRKPVLVEGNYKILFQMSDGSPVPYYETF